MEDRSYIAPMAFVAKWSGPTGPGHIIVAAVSATKAHQLVKAELKERKIVEPFALEAVHDEKILYFDDGD